jgi:hypothetical protein
MCPCHLQPLQWPILSGNGSNSGDFIRRPSRMLCKPKPLVVYGLENRRAGCFCKFPADQRA